MAKPRTRLSCRRMSSSWVSRATASAASEPPHRVAETVRALAEAEPSPASAATNNDISSKIAECDRYALAARRPRLTYHPGQRLVKAQTQAGCASR